MISGCRPVHVVAATVCLAVLAAGAIVACAEADEFDQSIVFSAYDSVGVRVVRNSQTRNGGLSVRMVLQSPMLVIGGLETDGYQLYGVEAAVRLSDGRIVVANGGTNQLLFFDAEGRCLATVGRKGSGPGEFQALEWVRRSAGDSLVVFDRAGGRISLFDPQGRYMRSVTPSLPLSRGARYEILGSGADGNWVVMQRSLPVGDHVARGLRRDSVFYLRLTASGEVLDTVGRFPRGDVYRISSNLAGEHVTLDAAPPLGFRTYTALRDTTLVIARNDLAEIREYDLRGRLRSRVYTVGVRRSVTSDLWGLLGDWYIDTSVELWKPFRAQVLATLTPPDSIPTVDGMVVDDLGNVWLSEYRLPGDSWRRWAGYDRSGRYLGSMQTPRDLEVLSLGSNYLLGLVYDEFDLEYVELYDLTARPQ